jgi:hypothetical protein
MLPDPRALEYARATPTLYCMHGPALNLNRCDPSLSLTRLFDVLDHIPRLLRNESSERLAIWVYAVPGFDEIAFCRQQFDMCPLLPFVLYASWYCSGILSTLDGFLGQTLAYTL